MNNVDAARLVAFIAAAFPTWPASKETVAVYAELLSDVSFDDGLVAVQELCRSNDRWPSVAQIRERVASRNNMLSPPKDLAWGEVVRQMSLVGRNSKPEFSHPAIDDAVRSIGWTSMCLSENVDVTRAHFWRAYDAVSQRVDRSVVGSGNGLALPESVIFSITNGVSNVD